MHLRFLSFLALISLLMGSCDQGKRYHDNAQNSANSEALSAIVEFQREQNETFKNPETSPLKKKDQKSFKGLDFFPTDTNYVVQARLERTPDSKPFLMTTTTDRKTLQVVYGVAHFELHGNKHQLEVFKSLDPMDQVAKHYLFLPFLDGTNGEETYAGGRYIDLMVPKGDTLVIDFNRAYNPYCVYNEKYSCPIVPRQNYLRTNIRAGVRAFNKE